MFGVEVGRLLRTKWKSAQTLAEELFALFNPNLPLEHNGPIKLTQGTDAPPIQIFMQPGTEGTNPIQIYRPDPTTGLIPTNDAGQPIGSGVGGTDLGTITFPPAPSTTSDAVPPSGLSPIMLYGSVVSGGPDNPFLVDCWARSPAGFSPIGRLTVLPRRSTRARRCHPERRFWSSPSRTRTAPSARPTCSPRSGSDMPVDPPQPNFLLRMPQYGFAASGDPSLPQPLNYAGTLLTPSPLPALPAAAQYRLVRSDRSALLPVLGTRGAAYALFGWSADGDDLTGTTFDGPQTSRRTPSNGWGRRGAMLRPPRTLHFSVASSYYVHFDVDPGDVFEPDLAQIADDIFAVVGPLGVEVMVGFGPTWADGHIPWTGIDGGTTFPFCDGDRFIGGDLLYLAVPSFDPWSNSGYYGVTLSPPNPVPPPAPTGYEQRTAVVGGNTLYVTIMDTIADSVKAEFSNNVYPRFRSFRAVVARRTGNSHELSADVLSLYPVSEQVSDAFDSLTGWTINSPAAFATEQDFIDFALAEAATFF
jgi:hypothetical protein